MERKPWAEDETFDDLMIDHLHPGMDFCPPGGFGHLPSSPEISRKSKMAVWRITGKTYAELTQEMIEAICKKTD